METSEILENHLKEIIQQQSTSGILEDTKVGIHITAAYEGSGRKCMLFCSFVHLEKRSED